ncbi:MAG: transposase, partial [Patescibacteria group bacterium]
MQEFIHIVSRGVDKRKIFLDKEDHLRFIHDMFEFNDEEDAESNFYFFHKKNQYQGLRNPDIDIMKKERKLIVHLHAFCLMSNHYHLLLTPLNEGSTTYFMRKLNIGYANYFNKKY